MWKGMFEHMQNVEIQIILCICMITPMRFALSSQTLSTTMHLLSAHKDYPMILYAEREDLNQTEDVYVDLGFHSSHIFLKLPFHLVWYKSQTNNEVIIKISKSHSDNSHLLPVLNKCSSAGPCAAIQLQVIGSWTIVGATETFNDNDDTSANNSHSRGRTHYQLGPSCSKLTMSLVNVLLKLWSLNMPYMLIFFAEKFKYLVSHIFSEKVLVN